MIAKTFLIILLTWRVAGTLLYEENFNGNSLNFNDWLVDVWPQAFNNELQYYTNRTDNIRVENGELIITPLKESYGGKEFTSGRINSAFSWKYGRAEIRAKLPRGYGLWPAIWMLSEDDSYGAWPKSGEIDICEARGEYPYRIQSTIHYGALFHEYKTSGVLDIDCTTDEYHVYTLDWTPTALIYSLDGRPYYTQNLDKVLFTYKTKGSPFDQAFHLILNVAIGGAYVNDPTSDTQWTYPDAEMRVDYFRVYDLDSIATMECAPTMDSDYTSVCDSVNWACGDENIYADVSSECTQELRNCCSNQNCELITVKELATNVFNSYDQQVNSPDSCDFNGVAEKQYVLNSLGYTSVENLCLIKQTASNSDICNSVLSACAGNHLYPQVSLKCDNIKDLQGCCSNDPDSCDRIVLMESADEVFQAYYDAIPAPRVCNFGGVCYLQKGVPTPLSCDSSYGV